MYGGRFGRHGSGFGPGGHGHGFGVRRGEFRFLVLLALEEKPMHGYAIIQEIGRLYHHGVSPGIVYPTLQELSQEHLIESSEEGGKRVYSLTDEGKRFLELNSETGKRLKAEMSISQKIDKFSLMNNIEEIEAALFQNAEYLSSEKLEKISQIISNAKGRILEIMFSNG